MKEAAALKAIVNGRVQGVFFRDFMQRSAQSLVLCGYVRNLSDGAVEVYAEGEKYQLDKLIELLKTGPRASRVENVKTWWTEYTGNYSEFRTIY